MLCEKPFLKFSFPKLLSCSSCLKVAGDYHHGHPYEKYGNMFRSNGIFACGSQRQRFVAKEINFITPTCILLQNSCAQRLTHPFLFSVFLIKIVQLSFPMVFNLYGILTLTLCLILLDITQRDSKKGKPKRVPSCKQWSPVSDFISHSLANYFYALQTL